MNNREKEIIETVKADIKNLEKNCKTEILRFLDYIYILAKELNYSDEFMEKLYSLRLRYYYNIGGNEEWETTKNKDYKQLLKV